jgi:hypothetical protein
MAVVDALDVLVGTARGLFALGTRVQTETDRTAPVPARVAALDAGLANREITALARVDSDTWMILDGHTVGRVRDGRWEEMARLDGAPATCLAASPQGILVGTEEAHLLRLDGRRLVPLDDFERAEGRRAWYTPWGDPPAVRSLAVSRDGTLYVNVHVGGVLRSRDGGRTWDPTLDIEHDVHQVAVHPDLSGVVLVAAAVGLGVSRDEGRTWSFATQGLHARYARAVAVSGDTIFLSASTGPGGRRAALYRKPLDGGAFERGGAGLPAWFPSNIDTACVAAAGATVAFGTEEGALYLSHDAGRTWAEATTGLPAIHAVSVE